MYKSKSNYVFLADGSTKQLTQYPYLSSLDKDYVRQNVFFRKNNCITFYMVDKNTEGLPNITDARLDDRFGTVMFTNNNKNNGQCTVLLSIGYYSNNANSISVRYYKGFYLFDGISTIFSSWSEL
jgi:hypothetical protein